MTGPVSKAPADREAALAAARRFLSSLAAEDIPRLPEGGGSTRQPCVPISPPTWSAPAASPVMTSPQTTSGQIGRDCGRLIRIRIYPATDTR